MKTQLALCSALGLFALGAQQSQANTITPQLGAFVSGVSVDYRADHTSAELHSGDGFTIFDIGGFTSVLSIPAGWTSSTAATGSPWGVAPLGADSASLVNVTFTYTGPTIETVIGATTFFPFTIGTTGTTLVTDDWTSRDHLIGTAGVIDGALGTPHRDEILVPRVVSTPDGGATAMLLGLGFLGAAGVRRKLS
jgi:hypothetical protein